MKQRFLTWTCVLLLLFGWGGMPCSSNIFCAAQSENDTVQSLFDGILASQCDGDIQDWIDGDLTSNAGVSSEWYILALCQYDDFDFTAYQNALLSYLQSNTISSAASRQKYALVLLGISSTDSYIDAVMEDSIGQQGIMSWIFGLHLLNNGQCSSSNTIESVTQTILSLQLEDGGWTVMGTTADVDVTAMVLQALAPQYGLEDSVTSAIDAALELLSSRQQDDGDFVSYGVSNPESTAQVLTALSALGIDAAQDTRFCKSGTIFAGLEKYRLENGAFSHTLGGAENATATTQVFYALVSYWRMQNGRGSLYLLDSCSIDEEEPTAAVTTATTEHTTEYRTESETQTTSAASVQTTKPNTSSAAEKNTAATTTAETKSSIDSASASTSKAESSATKLNENSPTDESGANTIAESDVTIEIEGDESAAVSHDTTAVSSCVETGYTQTETASATSITSTTSANESTFVCDTTLDTAHMAATATTNTTPAAFSEMDSQSDADDETGSFGKWMVSGVLILLAGGISAILILKKRRHAINFLVIFGAAGAAILFVWTTDFQSKEEYYQTRVSDSDAVGTVTISIRCDTVGDANSYIPTDGIILDDTAFEIVPGDTVYDILLSAVQTYALQMDNTGSEGQAYIAGIQYLYEFDYGDLSGWMYYVDGVAPSVGCESYELTDGEKIVWWYTLDMGKDFDVDA